ncbi:hypothetical protein AbraIFM66951_005301 [Aspergillus brasiliensis]|uniref:Kinesin-like protein n=1 Tax=Aspergillus brasiliensis TaxID=319629 RepID=A0A9W5Z3H7_9EURO|nr:hypothetical protein AbraCBS73388_004624 [Aspergillus brasiliensis]GKZ51254.1 hypothetical protein AbraIFM66951_005301 [Aspergillus brasiliensis]
MPSIKVFTRWRPSLPSEASAPEISRTQTSNPTKNTFTITLTPPPSQKLSRPWKSDSAFTGIFNADDSNRTVFEHVVAPTLPRVLSGHNCNFFAYGHSGSGKSHTIIGYDFKHSDEFGLCLSAAKALFEHLDQLNKNAQENETLLLGLRMYELRKNIAFDLLNGRCKCHIREGADGKTHVRGETETLADGKVRVRPIVTKPCLTFDEFHAQLLAGIQSRATGTSTIHDQSSRTHAVFEVEIVTRELLDARDAVVERQSELVPVGKRATDIYIEESSKAVIQMPDGKYVPNPDYQVNQTAIDEAEAKKAEYEARVHEAEEYVTEVIRSCPHVCLGGKMVFVDLAGSEFCHDKGSVSTMRMKQTPQEQQESRQINTDLLALKEVIRAMARKQARIPFRSSPLTMVLREHFVSGGDGGVSTMILTTSPSSKQYNATIDTLKYGNLIGMAGVR